MLSLRSVLKSFLMVPELGHFALIISFCLAALQFLLPLLGIFRNNNPWQQSTRPLALGHCFFITLSFGCLLYAFIQDDFSVAYVAQHSNATLPFLYKITAVWGGHEGSLLLWIFLLNVWVLSFYLVSHRLPPTFAIRVFIVLGAIGFGLLWFLLASSNPFARLLPNYPVDGLDLNPLLQDPGLIVHPPLLYLGYVGTAIPFAFAMSALSLGDPTLPWPKWMRPWVLSAFGFLTLGIALGSWWAYYELGWGGWWFWDPVENASFMPWLLSIALIHSLMVNSKQQSFQGWTLLLSILVFALSLLGTFLVRSGVLTSVHAFANDPKRGVFLLVFILLIVGIGFVLFAARGKTFQSQQKIELLSRETSILIASLLLCVAAAAILLGTLFPLIYDICTQQKISVGFPYFNKIFIPLIVPVLILIPLGPLAHWGNNGFKVIAKKVGWIIPTCLLLAIMLPWMISKDLSFSVILGLAIAFWVILGTLKIAFDKAVKRGGILSLSLGVWGMILAHLGVGILVIGITIVSYYQIERDVRIKLGQSVAISDYEIKFQNISPIEGSNYIGYRGHFTIWGKGQKVINLYPEKRLFVVQGIKMTETAIDPGLFRDLYVSLGDELKGSEWTARIYYKPFIRWIWFGAAMIAAGGFIAAIGRRNRSKFVEIKET